MHMLGIKAKKMKFIRQFEKMFKDNVAINLDLLEDFPGKRAFIDRMTGEGMVAEADEKALDKQKEIDQDKESAGEQDKALEERILGFK